jgi:hypothetical protein
MTAEAATIVSRREAACQCYWTRRQQQVRALLDTGMPALESTPSSCTTEM